MGRLAIHPSAALAKLLKDRRREMRLTLREVQRETEEIGQPIPSATINRVEQGKVDPGVKRLHVLLQLYGIPVQLAADLLEIEDFAADLPSKSVPIAQLQKDGVEHWRTGRLHEGMACLLAIRQRQSTESTSRKERHKALLSFSIAAKNLGKIRLAHQIVENLLLEPPEADLLVNVLVHGATCWYALGSTEAALGFLLRAESHLGPRDHKQRAWVFQERAHALFLVSQFHDSEAALDVAAAAYEEAGDNYGVCQTIGTRIQLAFARSHYSEALALSVKGRDLAAQHGFGRLRILRRIDEGRARFWSGEKEAGIQVLHRALGEAVAENDHVLAFYGHHALWKAYDAQGNRHRAELELSSAEYYARFVDEYSPEVIEVRAADRRRRSKRIAEH